MQYPDPGWGLSKWMVRLSMIIVGVLAAIIFKNSSAFYAVIPIWVVFLLIAERWMERHDPTLDIPTDEEHERAFADMLGLDEIKKK